MTQPPIQPSTTDSCDDVDEDMAYTDPPEDAYPEPEKPVVVSDRVLASTIETLNRFEDFFRHHASPAVHAELRAYVLTLGWHPVCGHEALLDDLGFDALALQWALTPTTAAP